MGLSVLIILIIISFIIGYTIAAVRIIREGNAALVERLGRYKSTLRSGLNFIVPIIDSVVLQESLREQILDLAPQQVISKEDERIIFDIVLYWRILDLEKAYYAVENVEMALNNLVLATLLSTTKKMYKSQILSSPERVGELILKELTRTVDPWGVVVTGCEIIDIKVKELGSSDLLELRLPGEIDWIAFDYSFKKQLASGTDLIIQSVDPGERTSSVKIKLLGRGSTERIYSDFLLDYSVRSYEFSRTNYESKREKELGNLRRSEEEKESFVNVFNINQAKISSGIVTGDDYMNAHADKQVSGSDAQINQVERVENMTSNIDKSSQNITQNIESNTGAVQAVAAGQDALSTQQKVQSSQIL